MALTGRSDGPALLPTAPLASCADGALAAFAALSGAATLSSVDGAQLLGERAATLGFARSGRTSPGGSCRLIETRDGWIAVNLARGADDLRLLPAWLECEAEAEPWEHVAKLARTRAGAELVARARLLGLAVAPVPRPAQQHSRAWLQVSAAGEPSRPEHARAPRVLDLSSLWAGPLCTHLLQHAGARVVKLESTRRPDGARSGPPAFFELLNAGKECVALDFVSADGRAALARLLDGADIVVEASRPRALRQLGVVAEEWVAARPGRVWLSITGYGRSEPEANWVAFGDDAAMAAGLGWCVPESEAPLFVGDAIADPLTGLHAALAAFAYWQRGQGALLGVALRDVVAACIASGVVGAEAGLLVAAPRQAVRGERAPGSEAGAG